MEKLRAFEEYRLKLEKGDVEGSYPVGTTWHFAKSEIVPLAKLLRVLNGLRHAYKTVPLEGMLVQISM